MNLYLFNYNNYYNRIVKKETLITDYGEPILTLTNANFNPNDGISAEHIFNLAAPVNEFEPDYCVVTDEYSEIVSRWFVIESKRERGGQYRITLYRDTVAESYDDVLTADTFIEKATLPADNPLIFNKENMTFNQIKTSETLLKDKTGVPWIVGYWQGKYEDAPQTATGYYDVASDITLTNLQDYDYYDYTNDTIYNPDINLLIYAKRTYASPRGYRFTVAKNGITCHTRQEQYNTSYIIRSDAEYQEVIARDSDKMNNARNAAITQGYTQYGWVTSEDATAAINEDGKIIYVTSTNKYYKVRASIQRPQVLTITVPGGSAVGVAVQSALSASYYFINDDQNQLVTGSIQLDGTFPKFRLVLEEFNVNQVTATISNTRRHTVDAPYDIFAIPFPQGNEEFAVYTNSDDVYQTNSVAWTAAMALAREYAGGNYLYDIQILPYCPILKYLDDAGDLDLTYATEHKDYEWIITGVNTKSGVILFAPAATFSTRLDVNLNVSDVKIEAETDMYRLCSPNYNGIFEFNLAKNGGISYIDIDCTYKPFNPYIHVSPSFSRLYGSDFDDARGLICGGDFSLPIVTDQWKTYELNNKNYENSFQRQIENMETTNSIQRKYDIAQSITGVATGALTGGTAGSVIGGGAGGAIGALIGAGASAAGGIADIYFKDQLRNEALDYTKDMHGYALGNIQALPYSLSKVGAYNANNKIFPFLEYYTCSDEEKQALRDKIKYNGMTVMTIGKIKDYLQADYSYIKGKIIRTEIKGDYHMINTLSSEINKGVFIK